MQSNGKHGRLVRDIPISKAQTFSCGWFLGVCSPFLLSSEARPPSAVTKFKNSDDFCPSDILLIQEGPSTDESSCQSSQAPSSGAETPHFYSSLNYLVNCTSGESSAPISPPVHWAQNGESIQLDFSRRLPSQEFLSDEQCIENLLSKVKKGLCTKTGLETLLRLVSERINRNVRAALEEQVGTVLIDFLISNSANEFFKHTEPYEEAFAALVRLVHNEVILSWSAKPEMLAVVDWILNRGNLDARVKAAILIQKISSNEYLEKTVTYRQSYLNGIVRLSLKTEHPNATKLALRTLLALCLQVENRCGAVRAGSVAAILKILPGAPVTSVEKSLAILELLGTTSEGRAAMTEAEPLVPKLVNIILTISDRATEYATGALCAICTPDTLKIQERVVHAGAQTRLLLLLQSHCTPRAKRKALQLLKVLHRFWDQEPCIDDLGQVDKIHY
jgi:hypothetical protein